MISLVFNTVFLQWLDSYRGVLSSLYPASYIVVRSIVGPPSVIWLCYQLQNSAKTSVLYRWKLLILNYLYPSLIRLAHAHTIWKAWYWQKLSKQFNFNAIRKVMAVLVAWFSKAFTASERIINCTVKLKCKSTCRNIWIAICLVSLAGSQLWSLSLAKTWWNGEKEPKKLADKLN